MNTQQQDPTQPVEVFLKKFLASLDLSYYSSGFAQPQYANVEAYATQFGKQIKPSAAVIVDGNPIIPSANDARLEFQKKWLASPLTNHSLSSFDCHLVPGTGMYTVILNGKVRFDESGRSRLGESSDLVPAAANAKPRPIWGSWFGFNANLVIDQTVAQNDEVECINSFNYRLTFKPHDSAVRI
ncbi:putative mRNA transport regulator [Clavispora lusitaniae]|uniref:mRNA transport regulator n=1 Tax=Clavispora lusitaniae TaxID=36911 RepID=A0ACD0WCG4_CLALS|nr:Nuclear pore RNA shuttling protein Mtr2 family protein [Clavispora lusitaniae]QFZ25140.1 putative mRNA transport regulator [Clavispora lusitaniae]QFZ31557.1 putative mRNA transport regulator [Clavispora lusitaniae]QFZ37225.1 putative mRNA transport regulator [Clavispora lusitaniae]QFZ42909.1 putative mRNA transport regulator [Clavispora lusitaniae]